MRDLLPALVLLIVSAGGLCAATFIPSGDHGQYAVVAPPWYNLTQTVALVANAGGDIVDAGGPANVLIVHSEQPGFVAALYRAGAWLVIDPMQLRGCLRFEPGNAQTSTGT